MRTIWNGTLELGDVAIPIGIVPTIRDGGERFKRLHDACKAPISLRSYCTTEEQLVEADDVIQAWEVAPGEYLVLDADELAALQPEETRRVPISTFVDADDIGPGFVRKRYWLAPSKSPVGRTAYAVFAEAMNDLDVAAIVRFVWRGEKIAAIYSTGDLLELVLLEFADDILRPDEIENELAGTLVTPDEVALARQLIGRHTRRGLDSELESLERPRIRALLDAKLAGQPIIRPKRPTETAAPASGDLASALKSSLKKAPRRRTRTPAAS